MNIEFLCKRFYTNKDLLEDKFGRLYHLPLQLSNRGSNVYLTAVDYRNSKDVKLDLDGISFRTAPAAMPRLPLLFHNIFNEIKRDNPDIIVASGDSHLGYIGLTVARKLGIPFVYDVYDYYPAFSGNRIPGMKSMFKYSVKKADLVLCASDSLRDILLGFNKDIIVVENAVDTDLFCPGEMQVSRKTWGIQNDAQVVGYFGSITKNRGPLLIEACRRLHRSLPKLRLVLAGKISGVEVDEPWIDYFGILEQREIPGLIRACDVVTIPYADDIFNNMCGACKIAEYVACEKPIVATRVVAHERIFRNASGCLCEPNVESVENTILRQLRYPTIIPRSYSPEWKSVADSLYKALEHVSFHNGL